MAQEMEMVGLLEVMESIFVISSSVCVSLLVGEMTLVAAGCFFVGPLAPLPFCFPFFLLVDFFFGGMVTIIKTTMLLPSLALQQKRCSFVSFVVCGGGLGYFCTHVSYVVC